MVRTGGVRPETSDLAGWVRVSRVSPGGARHIEGGKGSSDGANEAMLDTHRVLVASDDVIRAGKSDPVASRSTGYDDAAIGIANKNFAGLIGLDSPSHNSARRVNLGRECPVREGVKAGIGLRGRRRVYPGQDPSQSQYPSQSGSIVSQLRFLLQAPRLRISPQEQVANPLTWDGPVSLPTAFHALLARAQRSSTAGPERRPKLVNCILLTRRRRKRRSRRAADVERLRPLFCHMASTKRPCIYFCQADPARSRLFSIV